MSCCVTLCNVTLPRLRCVMISTHVVRLLEHYIACRPSWSALRFKCSFVRQLARHSQSAKGLSLSISQIPGKPLPDSSHISLRAEKGASRMAIIGYCQENSFAISTSEPERVIVRTSFQICKVDADVSFCPSLETDVWSLSWYFILVYGSHMGKCLHFSVCLLFRYCFRDQEMKRLQLTLWKIHYCTICLTGRLLNFLIMLR